MEKKDIFTVASIICSSLSLAFFCFILFSPMLACLGITFAYFAKRPTGKITNENKVSIVLACIGLSLSILMFAVTLPDALALYNSPEYLEFISQFETSMETN